MLLWLKQNTATGIVCLILAAAVFFAVRQIVCNRRQGKICCGDCTGCSADCKKDR